MNDKYFLNGLNTIFYNYLDHKTATAACRDLNQQLVTPLNEAENTALSYIAYSSSWLGISDKATENEWLTADGSKVNYFNWYGGEPNNGFDNNCAYTRNDSQLIQKKYI